MARYDLYRCYDKNGNLLYVGISRTALVRMNHHLYRGGWTALAKTITIEKIRNAVAARKAELRAIAYERPRFNLPSARWKQATIPGGLK